MQLKTRYVRKAPNGEETISIARNEAELDYLRSLEAEGYVFTEVKPIKVIGSVCISCEG